MVTVLTTSLILIAAILYALYRWQRRSLLAQAEERLLPPPQPGYAGLFGKAENDETQKRLEGTKDRSGLEPERRASLMKRAAQNDQSALQEASASGDAAFYDEILNRFIEQADTEKKLLALVSYIARETERPRVNRRLAERFMESWKTAPDRSSTARMLHVAALSDDATFFLKAVENASDFRLAGRIPDLSLEELRRLAESEYWILSQSERGSGQGFLLKRKLAALRRELTKAKRIS